MKNFAKSEDRSGSFDSRIGKLKKVDGAWLRATGYTAFALIAFAANSVLCRLALGEATIDAASFTTIRLVSGALLLLLWGGYETTRMPVDVFPDLTAPTVTIVTEAQGMAPKEVDTLITIPIERKLKGISDVEEIRSTSAEGISTVAVKFLPDAFSPHCRIAPQPPVNNTVVMVRQDSA